MVFQQYFSFIGGEKTNDLYSDISIDSGEPRILITVGKNKPDF
jgi:hypothetical protein